MRKNIILFLVIATISVQSLNADNQFADVFVNNMTSIVPQAKDNEFKDYQTCINTFFESMNNNDFNASLKCFPIKEEFQALNVKTYTDRIGMYKFSPDTPVPSNDSYNYVHIFDRYFLSWQEYYMLLFLSSNPEFMDIKILADADDYNNQMLKLQKMKNTKKYSIPKILEVHDYQDLNAIDKAMNIVEKKLVKVQISIDNEKFAVEMNVGRINNNWQILFVFHPDTAGYYP